MEKMFNEKMMSNLDMAEFEATLKEFQEDYNQKHFVRNDEFKAAADKIQGPTRRIFIEFLERSCTAEFSGFLLYKELGRRLKVFAKPPLPALPNPNPIANTGTGKISYNAQAKLTDSLDLRHSQLKPNPLTGVAPNS
eukprot:1340294-Pyramimonas_sp.AAC.2